MSWNPERPGTRLTAQAFMTGLADKEADCRPLDAPLPTRVEMNVVIADRWTGLSRDDIHESLSCAGRVREAVDAMRGDKNRVSTHEPEFIHAIGQRPMHHAQQSTVGR